MGLSAQNVAIVPTPSGVVDGHFPDGNDGSGAIPLVWAQIPSFLQKQVGSAFSVDLFTLYLTQPGGAVASIGVGTLTGGWSINGAGVLSYSGVGQGTGTIRVRATLAGHPPLDSNLFTFESIGTIVSADTLPPTAVTGAAQVSKTATTITVNSDVPADLPTSLIPASGLKEVRWFKGGIIDGVTSYAAGLLLRLLKLDVSASSGRKWFPGNWTAIASSQKNAANGLPNPGSTSDAGPVTQYTSAVLVRWQWRTLESGASGGTYNFNDVKAFLAQCAARGVALSAMIETRTFGGDRVNFASSVSGATSGTLTAALANGTWYFVFYFTNPNGDAINVVKRANCTVSGGTNVSWSGALPATPVYTQAIANNYKDNPMPTYLQQFAEGFISGITGANASGGWQGYRWQTPDVATGFKNLMAAWGAADAGTYQGVSYTFDTHPFFAGVCTQETSNGSPTDPNYTTAAYSTALQAEMDSIGNGFPHCRHLWFLNFGITAAQGKLCAAHGWQYGMIVAGPDLVMNNGPGKGILNNAYPTYTLYHTGSLGGEQPAGQGGPTACSIQPAEWNGSAPGDHRTIPQLYNYGTHQPGAVDDNGNQPLNLDIIIPDWHTTSGNSWNGATFQFDGTQANTSAIYAFTQHPVPFGTYNPPSSMPTGSVSQTGVDYDVTSYGIGIGSSTDQWSAANGSVNGDVTVICKINGLTSSVNTASSMMGLCIRDASGPSARAVYLVCTATILRSRYRVTPGTAVTNLIDTANQGFGVAKWIKITRVVDLFSFFYSTDGLTWIAVGTITLHMVPSVSIQLFAANTATTYASPVTGHFQQVNIQQLAKINYTFTGLTTVTPYDLTAIARDLANNDSAVSPTLHITTS